MTRGSREITGFESRESQVNQVHPVLLRELADKPDFAIRLSRGMPA